MPVFFIALELANELLCFMCSLRDKVSAKLRHNKITSKDVTPTITSSPILKSKDGNSSVSINVLKNWSACMTVTDAIIESYFVSITSPAYSLGCVGFLLYANQINT